MSDKKIAIFLYIIGVLLLIFSVFEIISHPYYDSSMILTILFYVLMGIIFIIMGYNKQKGKKE